MRIGLDLDGVCYDWSGTVRYLLRKHHAVELGEPQSWDHFEEQLTDDQWSWLWNEGVKLGLFRYGHHIRGSIDGIRELAKLGEVEIVTHRPRAALQDTLIFAARLPELSGFHFLSSEQPKSSIGCDVYVDDAPHVIKEVTAAGAEAIVFDAPYNKGMDIDKIALRAKSWADVPGLVELAMDISTVNAFERVMSANEAREAFNAPRFNASPYDAS